VIPKHNYYAPDVLARESERVFKAGYQYVGLTDDLANNRDFICVDHFGASIVVQNFKGELRAFQNVCSHMFSKIQMEERGNRPLLCRYHGWSYDETGYPAGMPRRSDFVESGERDERLCLTRYTIETAGKFVFIKRDDSALSLRDHLGAFHQVLVDFSRFLGPEIYYGNMRHAANWKLLVENVVDKGHCSILHKDSFVPLGFCRLDVEDVVIDRGHSSHHVPRTEVEEESVRRRFLSHLKKREFHHDSFYHINIFPNLLLASTEGISFYVGHVLPVGPDETILRIRYFEPNVELTAPRHRARQDLLNEQTNHNGTAIIDEDRVVLESIQQAVKVADGPGRVGRSEQRIHAFHRHYLELMGETGTSSEVDQVVPEMAKASATGR
jgi:phenylpropionate dioxygenase-like ring-hydroxylating dioxygenase large terminal subunit